MIRVLTRKIARNMLRNQYGNKDLQMVWNSYQAGHDRRPAIVSVRVQPQLGLNYNVRSLEFMDSCARFTPDKGWARQ